MLRVAPLPLECASAQPMWVWIRVKVATIERAINALRDAVTRKHIIASHMPDTSLGNRISNEADSDHAAYEELKDAARKADGEGPQ